MRSKIGWTIFAIAFMLWLTSDYTIRPHLEPHLKHCMAGDSEWKQYCLASDWSRIP